jgi:hypothetical protein
MDLLELFCKTVSVILESSHDWRDGSRAQVNFCNNTADKVVLLSMLCEFEEFLVKDGCAGIVVFNRKTGLELQWDEHKVLRIMGWSKGNTKLVRRIKRILRKYSIGKKRDLLTCYDIPHVHDSHTKYEPIFEELVIRLGAEKM